MKILGMMNDLVVSKSPDLRETKIKFNFLTHDPMQIHEVVVTKELAQLSYESYLKQLEGQKLELQLSLRQLKFQPDPNKPMVDMTRFELVKLPVEAEKLIAKETKAAANG